MTAFWLILKEHWPKVLAAILVPVIIGAFAIWMADRENDETQAEERLVESGRQEVTIKQQTGVLNNVGKAQRADSSPTLDERERERLRYDRCAAPSADCS